jgi:tagatose-1,6-bisphosphate aldolase
MDHFKEKLMAENENTEQPTEKRLEDFKGTVAEQRTQKAAWISKWGYAAYEKLVLNSSKTVQR